MSTVTFIYVFQRFIYVVNDSYIFTVASSYMLCVVSHIFEKINAIVCKLQFVFWSGLISFIRVPRSARKKTKQK